MIVYLVESSDWENYQSHEVHSIWSSRGKAEAEISRLRKWKIDGLLVFPKKRYSLYVVEHEIDPAT